MPGSHGNQLQGAESSHFNHSCEHQGEKRSRKRNKTINTQRLPTAMLPTYSKTTKGHNQLHFMLDPKVVKLPFPRRGTFHSRKQKVQPGAVPKGFGSGTNNQEAVAQPLNRKSARQEPIRESPAPLESITVNLWVLLYKLCLRMVGHLLWPLLRWCARRGPYRDLQN